MIEPLKHPEAIAEKVQTYNGRVNFVPVGVGDAEFILSLRTNPLLNKNISPTKSDVQAQVKWIEDYLLRYEKGQEAYFKIRCDGADVGTIRMYSYDPADNSFCFGSWLIKPNTDSIAAFVSLSFIYELGFEVLGFVRARFDVRQANRSVWSFHELVGSRLIGQNDLDRFYEVTPAIYLTINSYLRKFTRAPSNENPIS